MSTGKFSATSGIEPTRATGFPVRKETMGKTARTPKQLVVLDLDEDRFRRLQIRGAVLCRGGEEIAQSMRRSLAGSVWISTRQEATDNVLRNVQQCGCRRGPICGLITLEPPRPNSIPGLNSCFRCLAGIAPDSKLLPLEELLDVLSSSPREAAGLFIAAVADPQSQTLALTRGNLKTITVCWSMFKPSGDGVEPDFKRLRLTDYGHTVGFGDYEAASDAILYETDPEYRRKSRKKLLAEEKTFALRFVVCESRRASHVATSRPCRRGPLLALNAAKWRDRMEKPCGPSQPGWASNLRKSRPTERVP